MRAIRTLAIASVVGALAQSAPAQIPDYPPGFNPRVDDLMIVRLLEGTTIEQFMATFEADHPDVDLSVVDSIPARRMYLLQIDAPLETDYFQLEQNVQCCYGPMLATGEFVYEFETPESNTGSVFTDGIANAAMYHYQYATVVLGIDAAHGLSTGAGVVVGVVDTGVDRTHPELQGRVLTDGYNALEDNDDTRDRGDGMDTDVDGLIDEMVGHGTFAAGLITLTAPDAKILPVRVLNGDGEGNSWTLTRGLYFAIDRGVEVINLGCSSTYDSASVRIAIEEAMAEGIVTVAPAGNQNTATPLEYPASTTIPCGVAATDYQDHKAEFSNFNDKLGISAPGATVYLYGNPSLPDPLRSIISTVPGASYGIWSGTSMATGFVSGTIALNRAQHPEWPSDQTTHDAVLDRLAETSVDIDPSNPSFSGQLGIGRLDIVAAVSAGPAAPTLGDLNHDGSVDVRDLTLVLIQWGQVHSSADLNADGTVNLPDLLLVILNWG